MLLAKPSRNCLFMIAVVAFLIAPIPVQAQGDQDETPTVESIINRHIASIGTVEKLDSVTALLVESATSVPTPAGEITSTMNQIQSGDRFVMTFTNPQMGEMKRGSNGETYWSLDPFQGARLLEGAERETAAHQFSAIFPARNWVKNYGDQITLKGSTEIAGRPTFKVEFKADDSPTITRFFDQENGRIVKMETTQEVHSAGEMKIEIYFSKYQTVDGITFPFQQISSSAMGESKMVVKRLELNPSITDETFAIPNDVQALMKSKN